MLAEYAWPTNSPQQVGSARAHARQRRRRKGMSHVEVMEIVLQGYMPEVERAPRSPDSRAPASQRLPGTGVLVCPEGPAERGAVLLSWLFARFPAASREPRGQRLQRCPGSGYGPPGLLQGREK